jgi:hypothetical protein
LPVVDQTQPRQGSFKPTQIISEVLMSIHRDERRLNRGSYQVTKSSATAPRRWVIDIVELAKRHGVLLERILAKSTGAIGEILVADALAALGYQVQPTNNNARQSDLLVTSPKGASARDRLGSFVNAPILPLVTFGASYQPRDRQRLCLIRHVLRYSC